MSDSAFDLTGGSGGSRVDTPGVLKVLRRRWWIVVATTAAALLIAIGYVATAAPVYRAQARLLVSPIQAGTSTPANVAGLLYASADPTRDVQTAADVVDSLVTAQAVRSQLGLRASPSAILGRISIQPVSDSNVLSVQASASSALKAAVLANAFVRETITLRTAAVRSAARQQITSLSALGASTTATTASGTSVAAQIAELRGLLAGPLPDMSISATATPPPGRSSPRVALTLAAAIVVGIVVGILALLALEALDLRLRSEDQLRSLMRLPVLARIPQDGQRRSRFSFRASRSPRTPDTLGGATVEAFRTLRAMLLATPGPGERAPQTILVTSSAAGEGKTTTALNLAASLGAAGSSVILIEADVRRPSIGDALNIKVRRGIISVVTGRASLTSALVTHVRYPNVRFLLSDDKTAGVYGGDALFLPSASALLDDAAAIADYVIVDSPPLLVVIDALELARRADIVLLVAQLGLTDRRRLRALDSLLTEAHLAPSGFAVIGAEIPGAQTEEYYAYQSVGRPSYSSSVMSALMSPPSGSLEEERRERDSRLRRSRGHAGNGSVRLRDGGDDARERPADDRPRWESSEATDPSARPSDR